MNKDNVFITALKAIGSIAILGATCLAALKFGDQNGSVNEPVFSNGNPLIEKINLFKKQGVKSDFDSTKVSFAEDICAVVRECDDDSVRRAAVMALGEIAESACFSSSKRRILSLAKDV